MEQISSCSVYVLIYRCNTACIHAFVGKKSHRVVYFFMPLNLILYNKIEHCFFTLKTDLIISSGPKVLCPKQF